MTNTSSTALHRFIEAKHRTYDAVDRGDLEQAEVFRKEMYEAADEMQSQAGTGEVIDLRVEAQPDSIVSIMKDIKRRAAAIHSRADADLQRELNLSGYYSMRAHGRDGW